MAAKRRSPKNDSGVGSLLVLLIGVVWLISNFLKENVWLVFLIVAFTVVALIRMSITRKKKRAAYLRWYYDRERRINELNANNKLDAGLTTEILEAQSAGTTVPVGSGGGEHFERLRNVYQTIFTSQEIIQGEQELLPNDNGKALSGALGVTSSRDALTLEYSDGFLFYVFPETVLAFVEGSEDTVFLAAYRPDALTITTTAVPEEVSTIVWNRTQYEIRHYDKFNPIEDAEIISSN